MVTGEWGTIISPDYDAAPRKMPVPSTGIFDLPATCVPVNEQWIPFLTGVLDRLKWPDVWEGDDVAKGFARDQIEALLAAVQDGECPVELIEGPPGPPGPPGPQGIQGEPGEPGNPGADGSCVDCGDTSADAEISDEQAACGIAQYVIPWHEGRFQDMLDILDTSLNIGELVADVMLTWAGVSPITEAVVEAAVNAVTSTAAALRSDVPTTQLEAWQCSLYCAFKDEASFSKAKFDEWLAGEKAAASALGQTVWLLLMGMYGAQELNRRFIIGALTPSTTCATLCDDCPEECTVVSFAESGQGWIGQDSNVVWSGGAWIADTHVSKDNVWIAKVVPAGSIVSVKVYATNTGASSRLFVGKNGLGSIVDTGLKTVYEEVFTTPLVMNGTTDALNFALDYVPGASGTHPQRVTAVEICYA